VAQVRAGLCGRRIPAEVVGLKPGAAFCGGGGKSGRETLVEPEVFRGSRFKSSCAQELCASITGTPFERAAFTKPRGADGTTKASSCRTSVHSASLSTFVCSSAYPPTALPTTFAARGRPPIDRNALLRALIYCALRRLTSLSDLAQALRENPALLEAIGLDPLGAIPSVERFSDWLRSTPNESLQDILIRLLHALFAERAFTGRILALESCPVPSPVLENNLKPAVRDRFNKLRLPKGDPTARLAFTSQG